MVGFRLNIKVLMQLFFIISAVSFSYFTTAQAQTTEDEPFFSVTLLVPSGNEDRIAWAEMIAEELPKIGIGVEFIDIAVGKNFNPRVWNSAVRPIPIYQNGGYDIEFVGWYWDDFMYGRIDSIFEESSIDSSHNTNIYGYNNSQFETLYNSYKSDFNLDSRNIIFKEIQQHLYDQSPSIPIFHSQQQVLFNQNWNMPKSQSFGISTNSMLSEWAEVEIPGQNNITIALTWPAIWNSVTPFWDIRDPQYERGVLLPNMIYQRMFERDYNDNNNWKPLIANSMPTLSNDNKKVTVELRTDVKFSDNTNLTAYDVVESYRTYMTPNPYIPQDKYDDLVNHFESNESIVMIDDYTVEFNFIEPYIYYLDVLDSGILPIHLLGNHTNQVVQTSLDTVIFDQIAENGTSPFMVGSGPYQLTGADLNKGELTLEANPNYWKGNVKTQFINTIDMTENKEETIRQVQNGTIDLAYFVDNGFNLKYLKTLDDINYSTEDAFFYQEMGLNMQHPIFGTGIGTPLGQDDPNMAAQAAKYVRQAMSHIVPREKIIDQIMDDGARPGILPMPLTIVGIDQTLEPYSYDIDVAKELMVSAGYILPPPDECTDTSDTSCSSSNGPGGSDIDFKFFLMALSIIIIFRKKRQNKNAEYI